ncbi:hypothetical protein EJB05_55879, partial [Eragrostis curvula]
MAGVQELVPPVPRRDGRYHFLALLGASVVVLSAVGKPPVHAGYALAGFLLWLVGVARIFLFVQIGQQLPLFFPKLFGAAAANLAADKLMQFIFGRHDPVPAEA